MRKILLFICTFSVITTATFALPNPSTDSLENTMEYYEENIIEFESIMKNINSNKYETNSYDIDPSEGGNCFGSLNNFNLGQCAIENSILFENTYNYYYRKYYFDYGNEAGGYALAYSTLWFIDHVGYGRMWDYKSFYPSHDTKVNVLIDGKTYILDAEDVGNIHYGYVGSVIFSPFVLKSAAGFAQQVNNRLKEKNIQWNLMDSYFDDPKDQKAIARGIDWYNTGKFK